MAETKLEFLFKEAFGYQLKATIVEWNELLEVLEAVDISGFTTTQFKIKKPDETLETIDADFENDGTDGILVKTVTSAMNLLDQVGWYNMQVILATGAQYFPTQIVGFNVDDPL